MDWQEDGTVLSTRAHGESAAIVEILTRARGRHAGLVRGGAARKLAPLLQPGTRVQATWRARLEDHLGTFTLDPIRSRMGGVLGDGDALTGLAAICALLSFALPERQACPRLHDGTEFLLDMLGHDPHWPLAYLRWEMALLDETGYGLDLGTCAVTGRSEGMIYVSPRTGRAVTAEGAGAWASKLLPLPPVLAGHPPTDQAEVMAAFHTTGYFLNHHLAPALGQAPLPAARARLIARLQRNVARQGAP